MAYVVDSLISTGHFIYFFFSHLLHLAQKLSTETKSLQTQECVDITINELLVYMI